VFEQKNNVANPALFAKSNQLFLETQAGGIVQRAELEKRNQNLKAHAARFGFPPKIYPRRSLQSVAPPYILMASPYTLLDASSMASARVGCAWMVHIRSSTVASSSIAVTASAISSDACGPMMCTPRISPYFTSETIFMKPSWAPTIDARELAVNGNLPTLTLWPSSRAFASVSPTLPISGWQ